MKKIKTSYQAGGVSHKSPKAPDKSGAFISVQKRNLPEARDGKCLNCGGKVKKKGR